jgi:hypothetical protein
MRFEVCREDNIVINNMQQPQKGLQVLQMVGNNYKESTSVVDGRF